jgi:hypothetical protein
MNIHWLTILGIVMIGLGTLFTFLGQQIVSDKSNEQLTKKSEKIERLSEDNIKLNNELSKLNKKIAADLTGGDSYCYFLPSRPSKKSNIIDLMLMHEGDYPLYDISIKIDDVEKMMEILHEEQSAGNLPYDSMTLSNAMFAKASTVIPIGNLGPHQAMQLQGIRIPPDTDKKSYNIYLTARNGSVVQIVRYRRIDNNWKMAIKTTKDGEVIKETIDDDFPRNEKGEIPW